MDITALPSIMVKLEEELARYLLSHCPARTDEALMDRFAISYNTLRKIEAGLPIRRSVAARLEHRLRVEMASSRLPIYEAC